MRVREELAARAVPSAVPILVEQSGKTLLAGTSTFVRAGEEHLLVTASHVAKLQHEGLELLLPVAGGQVATIGGELAWATNDDHYDVSVARLLPECAAMLIATGYGALDVLDVEAVDPARPPDGGYMVVGFPSENVERTSTTTMYVPQCLGCTIFRGTTDDLASTYHADVHLLLGYDRGATLDQHTGARARGPHPRGMSGGAVWWAYGLSDFRKGWEPRFARWIGVQSAFFEDPGILKVVPWQYVEHVASAKWPDIARVLRLRGPGRFRADGA